MRLQPRDTRHRLPRDAAGGGTRRLPADGCLGAGGAQRRKRAAKVRFGYPPAGRRAHQLRPGVCVCVYGLTPTFNVCVCVCVCACGLTLTFNTSLYLYLGRQVCPAFMAAGVLQLESPSPPSFLLMTYTFDTLGTAANTVKKMPYTTLCPNLLLLDRRDGRGFRSLTASDYSYNEWHGANTRFQAAGDVTWRPPFLPDTDLRRCVCVCVCARACLCA